MKVILAGIALAATAASMNTIEPGNWATTVVMTDITLSPEAPPEITQAVQASLGGEGTTSESCLTQQDVDEGPTSIFNNAGDDCEYSDLTMDGGVIRGSAVCESPTGPVNVVMEGTYGPSSYAMTVNVDGDMGGGMGPMSLEMAISGERLGDCAEEEV